VFEIAQLQQLAMACQRLPPGLAAPASHHANAGEWQDWEAWYSWAGPTGTYQENGWGAAQWRPDGPGFREWPQQAHWICQGSNDLDFAETNSEDTEDTRFPKKDDDVASPASTEGDTVDDDTTSLMATVEQVCVENLLAEPEGMMGLATLGNRIPKELLRQLKSKSIRFGKCVRCFASMQVEGTTVKLMDFSEAHQEGAAASCRRGDFIRAMRAGQLEPDQMQEVLVVISSIHELLRNSDRPSESACSLGNKLAPRGRAFLRKHRARLIEVLSHFPELFQTVQGRNGGTTHFALAQGS